LYDGRYSGDGGETTDDPAEPLTAVDGDPLSPVCDTPMPAADNVERFNGVDGTAFVVAAAAAAGQ
jgi:hypothetical protein